MVLKVLFYGFLLMMTIIIIRSYIKMKWDGRIFWTIFFMAYSIHFLYIMPMSFKHPIWQGVTITVLWYVLATILAKIISDKFKKDTKKYKFGEN